MRNRNNEEIIREGVKELFRIYQEELENTIKEYSLNPDSEICADLMNQIEEHTWVRFIYLFPHYRQFLDEIGEKFDQEIYERYFEIVEMIKKKLM
ncbi:MAG: hypothetical protein QXT77_09735 [Candidatus Methanomethylicaceae archaeon]